MGAWLQQDATAEWIREVITPEVVYGKGTDPQLSAASILQDFSGSGFLATLDYTKCFDLLRPSASASALKKAGCNPQLANLCQYMWMSHVRWLSWDNHVGAMPLSSDMAVPQGDPLGPLICAVWLIAGTRYVAKTLPPQVAADGCLNVYMDDRTFTASSADSLRLKYDAWCSWSSSVGLRESPDKGQFASKTATGLRQLELLFEASRLCREITFLGVVSRGKCRKDTDKEKARIALALERMRVLGSLRLPTEVVGRYVATFALSVASYGWIARLPT